jgi:hypothetical protein
MKFRLSYPSLAWLLLAGIVLCSTAQGQSQPTQSSSDNAELEALRAEVRAMRSEYEARIAALEARLEAAERSAAAKDEQETYTAGAQDPYSAPTTQSPQTVSVARDSSFNPAIGVTFQGQAWFYENDPEGYSIPGFPLGGESGLAPEGLALGETEITMSANVDDKFTAMLNIPVVIEDGESAIEIEEAWIETLGMPAGLAVRMGRFYSSLGYMNSRHFHAWDFADAPLVYQALLATQYTDSGLQLRWLAPTDFYLELNGEIFRGGSYPAGGSANSGFGTRVLSARTGGDVGFDHSWLLGLSWLTADATDRPSGDEDEPLSFSGAVDLYTASFVWKWAPNGNWRQRNFKFQAEYLWRNEDGTYALPGEEPLPWNTDQSGWYAQAVYQPFPQWRFGGRVDRLSSDRPYAHWLDTPLYPGDDDPSRYSLMVDWSNSEFSRLRLQYNHDRSSSETDNAVALQYIFSIGAHGAHSF